MKKIVISTGGTGGHIFPAINLMKHFYEKKYDVLLVTDSRGNKFLKDKHEFKSYILKTTTPFRKNFIVFARIAKGTKTSQYNKINRFTYQWYDMASFIDSSTDAEGYYTYKEWVCVEKKI